MLDFASTGQKSNNYVVFFPRKESKTFKILLNLTLFDIVNSHFETSNLSRHLKKNFLHSSSSYVKPSNHGGGMESSFSKKLLSSKQAFQKWHYFSTERQNCIFLNLDVEETEIKHKQMVRFD